MNPLQSSASPLRVGLIYGHEPSGHFSAAQALGDFFQPSLVEPVYINLSAVYPNLGSFVAKTYLKVLNQTPAVWDYVYDNDFVAAAAKTIKTAIFPYYSRKITSLMREQKLGAIVSTHALATMLLAHSGKSLPLFAVLTDFHAHSYWPKKGVNKYFVPDKTTAECLKKNGIKAEAIITSGIPVRAQFLERTEQLQIRKELGLSQGLFTVLVTGGSKGLGNLNSAVASLSQLREKVQIIVLCGGNEELCTELKKLHCPRLKIIDKFTSRPAPFYAAADIVVGKAGGITIAETLAINKPMVVFAPLPGQEERNAAFLTKNKLAELVGNGAELASLIRHYLRFPAIPKRLQLNIACAAKPMAAAEITSEIIKTLQRL